VHDLEHFINSTVWEDMQRELQIWREMAGRDYDTAATIEEVRLIQGRREAIEYILALPETMLNALKEEQEDGSRRENDSR
jgi:hypothetical protein